MFYKYPNTRQHLLTLLSNQLTLMSYWYHFGTKMLINGKLLLKGMKIQA